MEELLEVEVEVEVEVELEESELEVVEKLELLEVSAFNPILNYRGGELPLDMIKKKRITVVNFYHLTSPTEIRARGLAGALGKKHKIYDKKMSKIKDENGIIIKFNPESGYVTICFEDKKMYEKVHDYDPSTVLKGIAPSPCHKYRISFPVENLREIS